MRNKQVKREFWKNLICGLYLQPWNEWGRFRREEGEKGIPKEKQVEQSLGVSIIGSTSFPKRVSVEKWYEAYFKT